MNRKTLGLGEALEPYQETGVHIYLLKKMGKRDTRKRCRGCYEKISLSEGCKVARNKARRVNTFCNECEGKPHLCITCFAEKHSG